MASRFDKQRTPFAGSFSSNFWPIKNQESEVVMLLYIVTSILCGHVTSIYGHFQQSGGVRVCLKVLRHFD